jgi:hypothetical protein
MNEQTIKTAYQAIHSNGAAQATIGLVTIIALAIMIIKIIKLYEEQKQEKEFNVKLLFDLIKQYGKYLAFICAFPFILGAVETVLADVQQGVSSKFNASVNMVGTEYIKQNLEDFIEHEAKEIEAQESTWDKIKGSVVQVINPFDGWGAKIYGQISLVSIYLLKYIFFFFCCGRYLWLLMLEIVAPIAIVLSLNEKTFGIFMTWVKNMLVCYLLIPFFLMADVFSEEIIKVMFSAENMSVYGIWATLGMITIKISLFGVVSKRCLNLLH